MATADAGVIEQLIIKGKQEIASLSGQQPMNFDTLKEKELVKNEEQELIISLFDLKI